MSLIRDQTIPDSEYMKVSKAVLGDTDKIEKVLINFFFFKTSSLKKKIIEIQLTYKIHPFKVYTLVIVSIFTKLCNHPHSISL